MPKFYSPKFTYIFGVAVFGLVIAESASATIIGGDVTVGTGSFVNLTVPFSESDPDNTVGADTFQDPNLYGFDEDQNIELAADLDVSATDTLLTGTTVASHYIFFDPLSATSQQGYVEFDSLILAIIVDTPDLRPKNSLVC